MAKLDSSAIRRLGFPVAVVVLVLVSFYAHSCLRQFRNDVEWRAHTHLVLKHIDRTQNALLGADAARKAYRFSRERADFDQIEERIATASREIDSVGSLTRDNASQQARVAPLRPLIAERAGVLRFGLDLPLWEELDPKTRDEQRAMQIRGSELAKRIGAAIDAMREEEEQLLAQREERAAESADSTQRMLVLGSALGIGLIALSYGILVLENRRRLATQAALVASNAVVTGVLDGTTDMIAVKDTEGRYLLANPTVVGNFNRPLSEILGKDDKELLGNESAIAIMAADQRIMREAATSTFEQILFLGGRTRTLLSTKSPYRDQNGKVVGVIAISRDISDRKAMEERVLQQNAERGENIRRLERRSEELSILAEMAALLQSTATFDEEYKLLAHFALRLFGNAGAFGLITPSRNAVETATTWGDVGMSPEVFQPTDCWALRTGRLHESGGKDTLVCAHLAPDALPCVCVPLVAQGETLGVLQLFGERISSDRKRLLGAFTEQLSLALANLHLRETLRSQAIRDPLTGLYNRRYMDETLVRELSRAARRSAPVSIFMIDLDHFKRLNDTSGHAAGDEVLKRFSQLLMSNVRREDVACRYGGEEFAVVLPELSLERAVERAEALCREIAQMHIELAGHFVGHVTASIGVSCYPEHGMSGEALVRLADDGTRSPGGDRTASPATAANVFFSVIRRRSEAATARSGPTDAPRRLAADRRERFVFAGATSYGP